MKRTSRKSYNFLPIINSWPEYFKTYDEGIGTTYERFILHKYFREIWDKYKIKNVIEVPSFGMTGISGINSMWWAKNGVETLIVDIDDTRTKLIKEVWQSTGLKADFLTTNKYNSIPVSDSSFDLVWNFAALWFADNLHSFFRELDRISKKVIFICVPNNFGLGYKFRELTCSTNIPDFFPDNILPKRITSEAKSLNWTLEKKGYFDIPPWPDIPMKKEDMMRKIGLGFLVKKRHDNGRPADIINILDFYSDARPDMEKEYYKLAFLESAPFPIKQLWGHHRYYIFSK